MESLEKAGEVLNSLINIGDNQKTEIAKRDKQFSTKENSYDVKTSDIGISVKVHNKDITWVQTFRGDEILIETKDYAFWIKAGVVLN